MAITLQSRFTSIRYSVGDLSGTIRWRSPDGNGTAYIDLEYAGDEPSADLQTLRAIYASPDGLRAPDGETLSISISPVPSVVDSFEKLEQYGYVNPLIDASRSRWFNKLRQEGDGQRFITRAEDATTGRVDHSLQHGLTVSTRQPGGTTYNQPLEEWEVDAYSWPHNGIRFSITIPQSEKVVQNRPSDDDSENTGLNDYPPMAAWLHWYKAATGTTADVRVANFSTAINNLRGPKTFAQAQGNSVAVTIYTTSIAASGGFITAVHILVDTQAGTPNHPNIPLLRHLLATTSQAIPVAIAREKLPLGDPNYRNDLHARRLLLDMHGSLIESEGEAPLWRGVYGASTHTIPLTSVFSETVETTDLPNEDDLIPSWAAFQIIRIGDKRLEPSPGTGYFIANRAHTAAAAPSVDGPPGVDTSTAWDAYTPAKLLQPPSRFAGTIHHEQAAAGRVAFPRPTEWLTHTRQTRTGGFHNRTAAHDYELRDWRDRNIITLSPGERMEFAASVDAAGAGELVCRLPQRRYIVAAPDAGQVGANAQYWSYSPTHWLRPFPIPTAAAAIQVNHTDAFARGTGSITSGSSFASETSISLPSALIVRKTGTAYIYFRALVQFDTDGTVPINNGPLLLRQRGTSIVPLLYTPQEHMTGEGATRAHALFMIDQVQAGDIYQPAWLYSKTATINPGNISLLQLIFGVFLEQTVEIDE